MGNEHLTVNIILKDYTVESDTGSWGLARTIIEDYDLSSDLQLDLVGEKNNIYVNLLRQRLEQENGEVDHFSQGEVIKIPNSKWQTLVITGLIAPKPTGSITAQGEPEETSDTRVRTHSTNSKKVIIIDPGHGGHDSGATWPIGATREKAELLEKDIALTISNKLKEKLESKYEVYLTRSIDVFIELKDRVNLANQKKADFFVSMHVNSYEMKTPTTHGIECLYFKTRRLAANKHKSYIFANTYLKKYMEAESLDLRPTFIKHQDLHVIRETEMPAILIETGFMVDENDRQKLQKTAYQDKIINSIVNAFNEYFDKY